MRDWISFVRERLHLKGVSGPREEEIVEDLAQQLEEAYSEELRRGATEEQARTAAEEHIPDWNLFAREISRLQRRQYPGSGGESPAAQERGEYPGIREMFSAFVRDLIFGARVLRKNVRFALLAMFTIMLGIGATTAIFSVVNGVILQPLPYDEPGRILWVWGKILEQDRAAVSPLDFQDYRANAKSFDYFAAMHVMHQFVSAPVTCISPSGPVKFDSAFVSAGFFEVFGASPIFGRTFQRRDEQQNANVVVLSHSAWLNNFQANPNIVGKAVPLNGTPFTIIGVMEPDFDYPLEVHLWRPLNFAAPEMQQREFHFLRPLVRLRSGTGIETAQAELETIALQLEKQYPQTNTSWSVRLQTLEQQITGELRKPLFLILAAVGMLLLIACVNVANLLLARATGRHKEIGVRVALGATRKSLVRQLLAENLLLSFPSGALGLILAYWSVEAFQKAAPDYLPRMQEVSVDGWTLLFTFCCSLGTAIIVSIAPALDLLPGKTSERLKEGKYSGSRTAAGRVRKILAVSEIALSLILLTGAGLLLKSFWKLTHVDLGFNSQNLLTLRLSLDDHKYPSLESVIAFAESTMQKIGSLPGVEGVAASTGIPLIPAGGDLSFTIEGRPLPATDAEKPNAQFRSVTSSYFETLSIPVLRGRSFSAEDHETSPKVVVVNDAFVRRFFPDEEPLGRYIQIEMGEPFRAQIVGIVKSTRQSLARPPDPEMYAVHKQSPMGFFILVVRARAASGISAQMLRNALLDLDPDLAFQRVRTMDEVFASATVRNRLNTILLGGAALLALLLAAIGIYGVLSFSVEQRKQEIGVRLALGAQPARIVTLVLNYGLQIATLGLLAGTGGALLLTRLMRSLLFEVAPHDPAILLAVATLLAAVTMLACWIPAYRAMRVDPLTTLRYE